MFHTRQGIEYSIPYMSTAVYVTYASTAGNTTYDVLHHLFHYQIVVLSVYIEISGHQSSEDTEHVLTHQDHPRLPPGFLLPPSVLSPLPLIPEIVKFLLPLPMIISSLNSQYEVMKNDTASDPHDGPKMLLMCVNLDPELKQ